MEVDIYQPCPCHADKRIKFCCGKDIVHDLNEILTLSRGRQTLAALDQIDRSLRKLGPRECLLTLKFRLQLVAKQYDEAEATNRELVAQNPALPMGHNHRAILAVNRRQTQEAMEALQDAMEAIPDGNIPLSMAGTFRLVGVLLMTEGEVMAARAHFRMGLVICPDDQGLQKIFLDTFSLEELPVLLRHEFHLAEVPDRPWSSEFHKAFVLASVGQWRRAMHRLINLAEEYPDEPFLFRSVATLACWLRHDLGAEHWGNYAAHERLDYADAVEAKSYQLLLSSDPLSDRADVVRAEATVTDAAAVLEFAASHPRLMPEKSATPSESIPPMGVFHFTDKELTEEPTDDFRKVPVVLGNLKVFGRQTDRNARIEFTTVDVGELRGQLDELTELFGEWIAGDFKTTVESYVSNLEFCMNSGMRIHPKSNHEQFDRIITDQSREVYLQVIPRQVRFTALGDRTLVEAAPMPEHHITVAAIINMLEYNSYHNLGAMFDFDQLRHQLGLPTDVRVSCGRIDAGNLSPGLIDKVDLADLDDDTLATVYVQSSSIGNVRVARRASQQIMHRPSMEERFDRTELLVNQARLTNNGEEASELVKQARQIAVGRGENEGLWLVLELDVRLEHGITEGCNEIIRVLIEGYGDDKEVNVALMRTMQRFGLMPQPNEPAGGFADQEIVAGDEVDGRIWTPGQAGDAESAAPESKLWIPD